MCLSPITINNPTKRIFRYGGQKLRLQVTCNQCAECLNRKRDEYAFRTYWHTKDTLNNGGYVIFDTLTYSDEYLPHLSDVIDVKKYGVTDFSCFDLTHYKLFFKRLRRAIEYKYHVVDAITYLFCSEYGVDDRYTHRPHYHFLLFVKYRFIDPLWLSRIISMCWQYGRTDGIKYKSLKYVARHIYGYDLGYGNNAETFVLRALTQYVSKYILKSSEFQSRLEMRKDALIRSLQVTEDELKELYKRIDMFTRRSKGYGLAYLDNLTEREIEALKNDECLLPDSEKVVKTLPLPMYYIRKLYYECVTGTTGNKVWQLTEKGIEHIAQKRFNQLLKHETDIKDLLHNATEEQRAYFYSILGNRTICDYCIYKVFYQGRMRDYTAIDIRKSVQYGLTDNELIDNQTWHNRLNECAYSNTIEQRYTYTVNDDDNVNMRNPNCVIISHDYSINRIKTYPKAVFVKQYTFNENSCYEFRKFDLLTNFLCKLTKESKDNRQKTYEFKKQFEERMKINNLL